MILPKALCDGLAGRLSTPMAVALLLNALQVAPPVVAEESGHEASSFVLRNYSPFTAIVAPPGRWPNATDSPFELSWNIANHSEFDSGGSETLLLDGETHLVTARFQRRLGSRLRVGAEIPWLSHSGGFLDGLIDSWHDLFGLSEGIRPSRASDLLEYVYTRDGAELFRLDRSKSGLGDITLSLAADFGPLLGKFPWHLRVAFDLPTGDADKLTGNGHTDVAAALGLRAPNAGGRRFAWWVDLGVSWPGDVDITGLRPSDEIFYYDAAVAWRALNRLDVLVQLAGSSSPYESSLEMLGDATLQVAAGVLWHVSDRYGIRVGFTEDIKATTAPDFGLELTVVLKRWR